jgi:hypothetical protein
LADTAGERLDIGHANPAHRAAFGRLCRGIQVQVDPVSFDDGKTLVAIRRDEAHLPIESQSVLQILDDKARGHTEKRWLVVSPLAHVMGYTEK